MFYAIAAFIIGTALLSVTTARIFRSAIWLLFALIGIAGLYFWMEVEFIAAVQIAVYVGGIVVLIIFSIFLTEQSGKKENVTPPIRKIASILAVVIGSVLSYLIIGHYNFKPADKQLDLSVERIGTAILNTGQDGFSLPFEVISILLLAAMIGCIVIALKANTIGASDNADEQQTNNIL